MTFSHIILSALLGMGLLETTLAAADTHYVAMAGQTPESPYTNGWPSAASNIQEAVILAVAGDTVLVSNGVYASGTTIASGVNRVVMGIGKDITVRSVNGPDVTIIKGQFHSGEPGAAGTITNGPNAVRCVQMNSSTLMGFTLTNGATATEGEAAAKTGGGAHNAWGRGNCVLSNCVIVGNVSYGGGGGVRDVSTMICCRVIGNITEAGSQGGVLNNVGGGTLRDCTIIGNSASDSAAGVGGGCSLYNCLIASNVAGQNGGGTYGSILTNCTLIGNRAISGNGGGVYNGTLYNCLLVGNSANYSGGAYNGTLYNCTVVGNSAVNYGGGVRAGTAVNSIVYFNTAATAGSSNWYTSLICSNTCTAPATTVWAAGNTTDDPIFVANGSGYGTNHVPGNYRLGSVSPCVNTGTNFDWMTNAVDPRSKDLGGQVRVRYGLVDMGCYECIVKGTVFMFR